MKSAFGIRLLTLLEERGMTQSDVCNATGISNTSMSQYIRDQRNPKIENKIKIAEFLGVPLSYFDPTSCSVEEEVAQYLVDQPDRDVKELSFEILDIIKASGIIDTSVPLTDETRNKVRKIAKKAVELVLISMQDDD